MSRSKWITTCVTVCVLWAGVRIALAQPTGWAWLPMVGRHCSDQSTAPTSPTGTPTPTVTPSPAVTCTWHTASLTLTVDTPTVKVGQVFTVTARLDNLGCGLIGLPLYRFRQDTASPTLFQELTPAEVLHYRGIVLGEYDEASFTLQAVSPGEASLRCGVSFEVHLGYPGPAYWGGASSSTLIIHVIP